jgi:hypothetical protein
MGRSSGRCRRDAGRPSSGGLVSAGGRSGIWVRRTFAELAAMAVAMAVYGSRARELINGAIADFR